MGLMRLLPRPNVRAHPTTEEPRMLRVIAVLRSGARPGDSVFVTSVISSPAFAVTARRFLFAGSFLRGGIFREYDVTPGDDQLLMITGGATQSTLIGLEGMFERLLYDRRQQR